jgi:hypothetical protein
MRTQLEIDEALKVVAEAAKRGSADVVAAFYDQYSCPAGSNAFLRAAKAGAFPTYRPGKRLLARREDVDRWIEAHPETRAVA